MSVLALTLESIAEIDGGKVKAALDKHLKRAATDCYDRPGDNKPRKVTLEIAVVPVLADDGSCSEVKAQMHVGSAVPKHRTRVISLGLSPNGTLKFNPDSPESIDQTTFLNDEE